MKVSLLSWATPLVALVDEPRRIVAGLLDVLEARGFEPSLHHGQIPGELVIPAHAEGLVHDLDVRLERNRRRQVGASQAQVLGLVDGTYPEDHRLVAAFIAAAAPASLVQSAGRIFAALGLPSSSIALLPTSHRLWAWTATMSFISGWSSS